MSGMMGALVGKAGSKDPEDGKRALARGVVGRFAAREALVGPYEIVLSLPV